MPDCPADEVLQQLINGQIPADDPVLGPHLQECDRCRARVEGFLHQHLGTLLPDLRALAPPATQPTLPPPPPVKAFVGLRFQPQRHHASGGLGDVFVAIDQEVGREVALKRMQPRLANRSSSRTRFEREAEITGRLEHPGVVPLYGRGRDAEGQPFYAMRYIDGRSLRGAIEEFYQPDNAKKGPGEGAVAFRAMLQSFVAACHTVAYAHSRGVIHRDLKPDNIMLGPYGETLVVDWGMAKFVGRDEPPCEAPEDSLRPTAVGDAAATPSGGVVGTPEFISPEQARGCEDVGTASDVFSLGATLYQVLTGRPPFQGATAILDAAARRFPPPREVRRNVPRALEAVCLKAMAIRPEDRYATAQDLAEDVERWLADEPTTAYREPWWVRAWRWVKRRRTPVAATSAALLAAVLLVCGGLWWKADHDAQAAAAAARQAEERDQDVRAGLAEVGWLRDQGRWKEAGQVLTWAEKLAANGAPAALTEQARQARKDLEMVAELEEAPLLALQGREGGVDRTAVPEGYRKAFQRYGIDMENLDPPNAAALIWASDIRRQLIVALDAWAAHLSFERRALFERLLKAALLADRDPALVALMTDLNERELGDVSAPGVSDVPRLPGHKLNGREFGDLSASRQEVITVLKAMAGLGDWSLLERHNRQEMMLADWTREGLERMLDGLDVDSLPPTVAVSIFLRLKMVGSVALSEQLLRTAQQEHPNDFWLNFFLFEILCDTPARREEAIGFLRAAVAIRPYCPAAHYNLGIALKQQGRPEEAEREYRRTIQLKGDFPNAHYNLGILLAKRGKRDEAVKELRLAAQDMKKDPDAHYNLGIVLGEKGDFDEAILSLQRALELLPPRDPLHRRTEKSISRCERLRGLVSRLPGVLNGEVQVNAAERVEIALVCQCKQRRAASVRLYAEAFAQQPTLAADLAAGNRYYAACAAALAGVGQGDDASNLDDKERARLRNQALEWLRADLTAWEKRRQDDPKARSDIQTKLQAWQDDGDLAGVRKADALARLPEAEREAWRKLWIDVEALVKELGNEK
jgi:tetratricopeptide (TPR) repeat protein